MAQVRNGLHQHRPAGDAHPHHVGGDGQDGGGLRVSAGTYFAKLVAGENAMKNARACIQVHGGMGYTWEIPAHYYLKR